MTSLDFAAVKSVKLSSVVSQSIQLQRAGREWKACCPFHPDKTPSFTVNDDKGIYHCFGCGAHGDAADFIAAIAGCGLREAVERLGVGDLPRIERQTSALASDKVNETSEAARRIWREAMPVNGTPARDYLWKRGIYMKLPETFRFASLKHPSGGIHPCLVALVTSPQQTFAGIQRTFLTEGGRKADLEPVKMSLGRIGGCAIRLAPAAESLIVCEGAEDGLSLQQELGRAVWCSAGASMLATMQFPPTVRSIRIAADNDVAGEREAHKAAAAYAERGLDVSIMRPIAGRKDFNEQLISEGRVAA